MNKLTKLLSVFVIAGAIGTGVAGVAGCTTKDDNGGHKHNYEYTQIAGNDQQHTVHCKNDGHEGGDTQANHNWEGDACKDCGYAKPSAGSELVIPANVTGILVEGVTSETISLNETKKSHTIDKSAIKVYFATGNNADVKGDEVPTANVNLRLTGAGGVEVASWENITKDGVYTVRVNIKNATMAEGAVATVADLTSSVTVTVSNPVKAGSLVVKEGATLEQVQSVQDKMTSTWTYEVERANGDKEDVPAAEVKVTGLDTNTVAAEATATLTWGTITGSVKYKITVNANLHVQSYAANMSVLSSAAADEAIASDKTLIDSKSDGTGTVLQVTPGDKAKFSSGTAETENKYFTRRIQFGGGTYTKAGAIQTNKRYFTLKTEGPAKLTIVWNTNGSAGRGIKVYSKAALGDGGIDGTNASSDALYSNVATDKDIKTSVVTLATAGEYYITTANDGDVYFFYFQVDTEFDDAEATDVVLQDGDAKLAKLSVKTTTEGYKQTFTVGDVFSVNEEYSFEGTFATVNTGNKSKQTLTTGVTYWLGATQLIPGTTHLNADLFTRLGDNAITVKYNEETITGSYTISVESAVPGVTGISASIKDTVDTNLSDAAAKLTLNKTDIEAAIVGENANASVQITSVKYRLKNAEVGSETEITDSVELGVGEYVIVVTASVTDSSANKSANFETTVSLKVAVAGAETVVKAEDYTAGLKDAGVDNNLFTITTDKTYNVTDYSKNDGKAISEDGKEFTKAWLPGGNISATDDRGFTITAKKDISITVYFTLSDSNFGNRTGKLIWTTTPTEGAATTGESDEVTSGSGGTAFAATITLKAGDTCRVSAVKTGSSSDLRPAIFGFAATEPTPAA